MEKLTINTHSSIRLCEACVLYFDPFRFETEPHDADIVFITHEHFDHFSPEDIRKISKEDTVYVMPLSMQKTALKNDFSIDSIICLSPNEKCEIKGIKVEAVPAYNIGKLFHPKGKEWLGYVVTLGGLRHYIMGDSDATPEAEAVSCDVLFCPVGGTYTMTAPEAAELTNRIMPDFAIPTHYGSVAGSADDGARFASLVSPGTYVRLLLPKE